MVTPAESHDQVMVTVLIDSYNSAHLIDRAIYSVLRQAYPPSAIEILIIDDGSTDNTAHVVRQFGDRVRYVRKPNRGQASAINEGIRLARGEIICLLDGDDIFYPDKTRLVVDEFQNHPRAGIVCTQFDVLDSTGNRIEPPHTPVKLTGDITSRTLLGYGCFGWVTSSICLRKSLIRGIEIPEEAFRLYVDYFLLSIVPLVAEVAIVDTPSCAWVLHGGNQVLQNPGRFAAEGNVAVRQYARAVLGESFVTYLGRGDYGVDTDREMDGRRRLKVFIHELVQIASAGVEPTIKLRAELKLVAALLLPVRRYGQLKSLRRSLGQAIPHLVRGAALHAATGVHEQQSEDRGRQENHP